MVATDNTFTFIVPESAAAPYWVGKCIHCGTKLFITEAGNTDATLEHIKPLCDRGDPSDPRNLALACKRCNNEKGVRHDRYAGMGSRADEVIAALQNKREERWRPPVQVVATTW